MQGWLEEHRAFAVETFFKNNDSAIVTQRVFRRYFDVGRNGKVPTCQTILNWVTQFRTTTGTEGLHLRGNSRNSSKYVESHGQCQTTCRDVPYLQTELT